MKLELVRYIFGPDCTIGKLSIDGLFECFTLEDIVREVKFPGKTAIPAGKYTIVIDMSQRFKRMMPRLLNVPNFEGVRIHAGNSAADTEGCPLVGLQVTPEKDRLLASRIAFETLFIKLEKEFTRGQQITIEIINDREAAA